MGDELLRADLRARGAIALVANVTETALEAEWRHLAGRIAANALGRAFAATALAAGFLLEDEQLSLQIKSQGKLRGLLVDIDASGNLRGYTEAKTLPIMDGGPSDLSYAIGSSGTLVIIRSTSGAVSYSGAVELGRGDIASDLEHYLATSEQRDSIVELATRYHEKLEHASGILVQAQPGVDRAFFDALRARRASLSAALLEARDPETVLARVFPGEAFDIVERRPLRFRCRCSRERVFAMLGGLDPEELRDMIEKDRGAAITCHFCNDRYDVDEAGLRGLLERRSA